MANEINWSEPPKTRDRLCYVGTVSGKMPHGEYKVWVDGGSICLYYTQWRDKSGGAVAIQTRILGHCSDLNHAKTWAATDSAERV